MKGPHICDCLCALCERLGTGAFGPQPDGSPGVVVIRRRRGRRHHAKNHTKGASRLQPQAGPYLGVLAPPANLSTGSGLPESGRPGFRAIEVGLRSLGALRGGVR